MEGADVRELPGRIEALLDDLTAAGDPLVSECAEQLVATLAQLYGEGLKRTVDLLAASPDGEQTVRRLAEDELVGNLLLLHGLHPDDLGTRIQQALDRVRPYLGSHAGGIDYLGVTDAGVAMLRLEGSCDGCAGSAATVHSAVERAVLEAAPEVTSVKVEGMVEAKPAQLLQIGMHCPDGLADAVSG
ncbi:MAG TPA: NifU family protein [Jatrophihabitantaceae bacterium]|jgi:Fe-S cluster biogenesis protein NfuA|nr:NifU family protein [Jatrophihabitantaceae bacterium]